MRLLIVGTGNMARQHAACFGAMEGVELAGAVDLRADVLADFCAHNKISKSFSSLDDALGWNEFDAAAIVTPDNAHKDATLACLAAGKHVLCEKPLAPNYADAKIMADAAERAGSVAMVNLTYRGIAQLNAARNLVDQGKLGEIRHIEASYLQSWLNQDAWGNWRTDPTWLWRLSTAHGSLGVLGDIGVHLLDFVCYGSGLAVSDLHARLQTFAKAPGDRIGEYALDANDSLVMHAGFEQGAVGVIHATRWAAGHHNDLHLRIYGTDGGLELHSRHQQEATLRLCSGSDMKTADWQLIDAPASPTVMELFARAVMHEGAREPGFRHAANLQRVLDAALESAASGAEQKLG